MNRPPSSLPNSSDTNGQRFPGWQLAAVALIAAALLLMYSAWTPTATLTPQQLATTPPTFSHPTGYYAQDLRLNIGPQRPPTDGTIIIYTRDGSEPQHPETDPHTLRYTGPIYIPAKPDSVVVIRARFITADQQLGPIATQSFVMGVPSDLPILSLVTDPSHLWEPETGIYVNPTQHGREWERPAVAALINQESEAVFELPAGLRIHGQFSRSYNKKSLRLYFRESYGQAWLQAPLFDDASRAASNTTEEQFKRLVLHAGGQDTNQIPTNWSLIRNHVMADLASQTAAHSTRSRPVLLFINGQPWGVYYLRERIDRFFLGDTAADVPIHQLDTPARRAEHPPEQQEAPGYMHWDQLTAYIETHDLADSEHYAYIQTQVDIENFIDYSILQIYSANFDWPFTNNFQFRPAVPGGRWQWVIWDNDLSLGLKPWSDVGQNTITQSLDPNYTAGTELAPNSRDTILLRALLVNPDFKTQFLQRADQLLDTTLSTESVIATIDQRAAELGDGVLYESQRWEGDPAKWQNSVEQLREFARARPAVMRQHLNELYPEFPTE